MASDLVPWPLFVATHWWRWWRSKCSTVPRTPPKCSGLRRRRRRKLENLLAKIAAIGSARAGSVIKAKTISEHRVPRLLPHLSRNIRLRRRASWATGGRVHCMDVISCWMALPSAAKIRCRLQPGARKQLSRVASARMARCRARASFLCPFAMVTASPT